MFPCGDGVRVLFQYPECVLEGADRVRVFGKDSDRLRYVAERRVRRLDMNWDNLILFMFSLYICCILHTAW